jgi:DNA-binding response OmpR family regulator
VARRLGDENRTPAVLLVGQDGETLGAVEVSLSRLRRTVEVSRATSARMALLALRTTVIDLVVFVPDVPDLGAPELLSSIRALPAHGETPLIVSGAVGDVADLRLLERYGASCVLPGDVRGPLYSSIIDAELDAWVVHRGRRGTHAYPG